MKTPEHIAWDAYFLYGPEVDWSKQSELISRGRAIAATRKELQANLTAVLTE